MALNAASHNPTGNPTGSVSGPPPPLSTDTSSTLKDIAGKDSTGQDAAGRDKLGNAEGQTVMGEAGKEKTAEEIEKEHKP
jgi:valyl-tRNA synthetase